MEELELMARLKRATEEHDKDHVCVQVLEMVLENARREMARLAIFKYGKEDPRDLESVLVHRVMFSLGLRWTAPHNCEVRGIETGAGKSVIAPVRKQ